MLIIVVGFEENKINKIDGFWFGKFSLGFSIYVELLLFIMVYKKIWYYLVFRINIYFLIRIFL